MGLPSGNRWAVSNLDVTGPYFFQESPFQFGCSFFSWGNTTPHNPNDEDAFDYDFGGINNTAPYYEGRPYGDTPGSDLADNIPLSMDASRILLGSPWRMPASLEFSELFSNIIFIDANGNEIDASKANKIVSVNGVMGIYIQSKINGKRLFFPCVGYGNFQSLSGKEGYGFYWSSTIINARDARNLYITSAEVRPGNIGRRYIGGAIRPIWNPRDLRG